jgi:CBS domain-containing protein
MTCDVVRDLLSAHLDGELDGAELRLVETHLAGCPACTAEREGLLRTVKAVKGLPRESAPANLAELVRAALPSVSTAPARGEPSRLPEPAAVRRNILTFPRMAAAFAAVLLVGITVRFAFMARDVEEKRPAMTIAPSDSAAPRDAERAAAVREVAKGPEASRRQTSAPLATAAPGKDLQPVEEKRALAPTSVAAAPPKVLPARREGADRSGADEPAPPPAADVVPATPVVPAPPPAPVMAKSRGAKIAEEPRDAGRDGMLAADKPAPDAKSPALKGDAFGAPKPETQFAETKPGAAPVVPTEPPASRPKAVQDPLVVLAVRSGDPAQQAAQLDQLAYGPDAKAGGGAGDPGRAKSAAERNGSGRGGGLADTRRRAVEQAVARKEPVTLVYDLPPEEAARFMTALRERDIPVSVEETKFFDIYAATDGKAGVLSALAQLTAHSRTQDPASQMARLDAAKKADGAELRKGMDFDRAAADKQSKAEGKSAPGATSAGLSLAKAGEREALEKAKEQTPGEAPVGAANAGAPAPPPPATVAAAPAAPPAAAGAMPAKPAAKTAALTGGAAEAGAPAADALKETKEAQAGGQAAPRRVRIVVRLVATE